MRMTWWLVVAALLSVVGLTRAWWVLGHASVAEAAVSGLPDDMPAFFRAAAKPIGYYAGEPDRWKNPSCKHLRSAEAPDHFIDLEDFEGKELPGDRWKAIAVLQKLKKSPDRVGFLPWAIMENFDRLSTAFYDYRENSKNPAIQAKCLVYAGILAHLSGDAAMPLHTTRNYDGRRNAEGVFVQKGIHAKIDAFPEKNGLMSEEIGRGLKASKIEDVWKRVLEVIEESHTHIHRCYELDEQGAFDRPNKESREFIMARCRAASQFTMDLWYTAYVRSATMPKHY